MMMQRIQEQVEFCPIRNLWYVHRTQDSTCAHNAMLIIQQQCISQYYLQRPLHLPHHDLFSFPF